MTLSQDVDAIISDENITDANPSVVPNEEPITPEPETPEQPEVPEVQEPETPAEPETPEVPTEVAQPDESLVADPAPRTPVSDVKFDQDKMFDEQGNVRDFKDVADIGKYLNSQIKPVEVVGKDGKTYQFNTIADYREQFPQGLEVRDGIEKTRLERGLVENEDKFNLAVEKIEEAKAQYEEYTNEIVQTRERNNTVASEYRAMADAGLVPKVGDPADPKFGESEAVKELNTILEFMDTKNAELAKQGIPPINSLYVAKQFMDTAGSQVEKTNRAQQIIQERSEVASLSQTPPPEQSQRRAPADIPMSRLADSIIAEEGLR